MLRKEGISCERFRCFACEGGAIYRDYSPRGVDDFRHTAPCVVLVMADKLAGFLQPQQLQQPARRARVLRSDYVGRPQNVDGSVMPHMPDIMLQSSTKFSDDAVSRITWTSSVQAAGQVLCDGLKATVYSLETVFHSHTHSRGARFEDLPAEGTAFTK